MNAALTLLTSLLSTTPGPNPSTFILPCSNITTYTSPLTSLISSRAFATNPETSDVAFRLAEGTVDMGTDEGLPMQVFVGWDDTGDDKSPYSKDR